MMALRRAGFFRELGYGNEQGPSLEECRHEAAQADEALILGYLESGSVLVAMFGVEDDYFDPAKTAIADTAIVTDGTWCWPGELAHYVREYHVAVPADFVAHMRQRSWQPSQLTDADLIRLRNEESRNASNRT